MQFIQLKVLVKATGQLTTVTACSQRIYFRATYSAGSISESGESDSLVDESLNLMLKDYFHATYFCWKYQ